MPLYRPYTEISSLPANGDGDVTILEAHLDSAHATITDVLERIGQALFTEGGVVIPGSVTNPSGALVRVVGRMGVSHDARTFLAVGDASVDLDAVTTGTRCLVVIRAAAGASSLHQFVDAVTGESITHSLLSEWGQLAVLEGDASSYPALPPDCVPVARVTKTGATSLTVDAVLNAPPTSRYGGGGGGAYDLQLGFAGQPADGAADVLLVARPVTISATDPGVAHVGVHPSAAVVLELQVNGVSAGSVSVTSAGVISWSLPADVTLATGDRVALVAPSPADASLADVLVALKGQLA